jgi:hypothetical protein
MSHIKVIAPERQYTGKPVSVSTGQKGFIKAAAEQGTAPAPQESSQAVTGQVQAVPGTGQNPPPSNPEASATPDFEKLSPWVQKLVEKELAAAEARRQAATSPKTVQETPPAQTQPSPTALTQEQWLERFKANPKALGLTEEDLANAVLGGPSPEQQTIEELKAEIEALKGNFQGYEQRLQQGQQQAYQNAVAQLKAQTEALVSGRPEDFEMIALEGAHDRVVSRIEEHYQKTGFLMSVQDAAKQLEDELMERALKIAASSKVKSKLMPESPAQGSEIPPKPLSQGAATPAPTLDRGMGASSKPLSRTERALAAALRVNKAS